MDKFNYANAMEVPKLEKITINIGLGEAKGKCKIDGNSSKRTRSYQRSETCNH